MHRYNIEGERSVCREIERDIDLYIYIYRYIHTERERENITYALCRRIQGQGTRALLQKLFLCVGESGPKRHLEMSTLI